MSQPTPPPAPSRNETVRIERWLTLAVLAILIVGCYLVLQPFLSAILWAVVLCCTTWPLLVRLERATRGRTSLSAALMTVAVALILLAPLIVVATTLAENSAELLNLAKRFIEDGPPDPPAWVVQVPLIGERLNAYWTSVAHDTASLLAELKQYIQPLRAAALSGGTYFAQGVLQLTLSILIIFFLYRDGEVLSVRLNAVLGRIAGERGAHLAKVATGTMRGVVYGLIGTALVQGVLAAIGFWIAGVPAAPLLGLLTFLLSPVPIGPPLVWIPAAIWLFYQGSTGWGIFMAIWGIAVVSSVDNVIKPMIISRGSNLPFILVLLGVLGGVVAFGFIGVFLGPTLLAIGYALVHEWSAEEKKSGSAPP